MMKETEIKELYSKFTRRKKAFILFLFLLTVFLIVLATSIGTASIPLKIVFSTILSKLSLFSSSSNQISETIIWELRLPRILMAVVAGAGLAIAGCVMQGILRNPLASPYTLGVSSGAGFGAALAIVLGAGVVGYSKFVISNEWLLVTNAFIFALIPAMVILLFAKLRRATPETMILAGIAMMYLFSAMLSLLEYVGAEKEVVGIVYWLFGSLSKASWLKFGVVSAITLPLFIPLLLWSWDLNALSAGDETAKSLGVNVDKVRMGGMTIASLVTALAVSFLGVIGFIGLVSPHITRMIIGGDHRFLLPASCLVGANLLLAADTVARTIISPIILPVGILTSFLGVPLFIYLILKRRREYW